LRRTHAAYDEKEHAVADRPTIFISGAANGIGRATADRFARGGYAVGVYDIDEAGARAVAASLGGNARSGRLDVTDPESWNQALRTFAPAVDDRLDVLINNAGIMHTGALAAVDVAAHARTIDVNAKGVVFGCHAAHPYLRRTPGARLVNLASASAIYGQPDMATYSATKFFVRGFTEALQIEWKADGIAVAAVWPLYVDTALVSGTGRLASMEALGVRLTSQDVADDIWQLATRRMKRSRRTHHPVGFQTHASVLAEKLAPTALTRFTVARLAGR